MPLWNRLRRRCSTLSSNIPQARGLAVKPRDSETPSPKPLRRKGARRTHRTPPSRTPVAGPDDKPSTIDFQQTLFHIHDPPLTEKHRPVATNAMSVVMPTASSRDPRAATPHRAQASSQWVSVASLSPCTSGEETTTSVNTAFPPSPRHSATLVPCGRGLSDTVPSNVTVLSVTSHDSELSKSGVNADTASTRASNDHNKWTTDRAFHSYIALTPPSTLERGTHSLVECPTTADEGLRSGIETSFSSPVVVGHRAPAAHTASSACAPRHRFLRRRHSSVTRVAERWRMTLEDTIEIMINVDTANINTPGW